jgi:signal transduction histidine kinase
VRVARHGEELTLEVRNGAGTPTAAVQSSGGHGLVGVRERVAVFGGTLRADATGDGGFVLSATLPGAGPA